MAVGPSPTPVSRHPIHTLVTSLAAPHSFFGLSRGLPLPSVSGLDPSQHVPFPYNTATYTNATDRTHTYTHTHRHSTRCTRTLSRPTFSTSLSWKVPASSFISVAESLCLPGLPGPQPAATWPAPGPRMGQEWLLPGGHVISSPGSLQHIASWRLGAGGPSLWGRGGTRPGTPASGPQGQTSVAQEAAAVGP